MNLADPDPSEIPHSKWDSYEAMAALKRVNKWVSAIALVGALALILLSFDLTDRRPAWAKQFEID